MQVPKVNSSVRRLFASLDINYNNSLNTELHKHNETKIKKLKITIIDPMIFEIHCFSQIVSKSKL